MFTPDSTIRLLSCPLSDNKNQLRFLSAELQAEYFLSCPYKKFESCTFLRQDKIIKVNIGIDNLYRFNYVMFQNSNYTNKWFYAFIEKYEYVSQDCTALTIKTDVYQTWCFDFTIKPSFVVREHTADDTIGFNIVNEGLELGEEYILKNEKLFNLKSDTYENATLDYCIVWATASELVEQFDHTNRNQFISGIPQGCYYYCVELPNLWQLNALINNGHMAETLALYMLPKAFITNKKASTSLPWLFSITSDTQPIVFSYDILSPEILSENYIPKNNKLFTYPYTYLKVENGIGESHILKFEYGEYQTLEQMKLNFLTNFSLSAVPSLQLRPSMYKHRENNFDYSIAYSNFPPLPIISDTFKNFIALNHNSLLTKWSTMGVNAVGGVASAGMNNNPMSVISSVTSIFNEIAQIEDLKNKPDNVKGGGSSYMNYATENQFFNFSTCSLQSQSLKRIDAFFTMFGYKVNQVKIPETHSRIYFNYIETRDINLIGDIPKNDMNELKNMFNTGITLWHSPSQFCDYSVDNHII